MVGPVGGAGRARGVQGAVLRIELEGVAVSRWAGFSQSREMVSNLPLSSTVKYLSFRREPCMGCRKVAEGACCSVLVDRVRCNRLSE